MPYKADRYCASSKTILPNKESGKCVRMIASESYRLPVGSPNILHCHSLAIWFVIWNATGKDNLPYDKSSALFDGTIGFLTLLSPALVGLSWSLLVQFLDFTGILRTFWIIKPVGRLFAIKNLSVLTVTTISYLYFSGRIEG